MLAGNDRAGGVVSRTFTVNDPVPMLPCESDALHCTVVTAIGYTEPDAWSHVTGTVPSTSSTANAEYVTVAPLALVASAVMLAGSESTGGVRSRLTFTSNEPKPMLS